MHLPKTFLAIGIAALLGFSGAVFYLVFQVPLAAGLAGRMQLLIAR
jgi:ABC-type enterobactin transport system permease subunit